MDYERSILIQTAAGAESPERSAESPEQEAGSLLSALPSPLSAFRIQPTPGWRAVDLRELWRYRELLYFLVWRDLKVRYKQTVLGAAWALIRPLFTMLMFTLIFGTLAKIPSDGIPYPIFSYAALLPWTYFATALGSAGNGLVGSAHLITKVYFPRLIIPGSLVIGGLVDYAIAFVLLIPLMFWYGVPPSEAILLTVPLLTLLTAALALGVTLWVSALTVQYRDLLHIVPFALQLWLYATPLVYPLSLVPPQYRWLAALNPMTGIIEGFRSALLGSAWNWPALGLSLFIAVVALVSGALYF